MGVGGSVLEGHVGTIGDATVHEAGRRSDWDLNSGAYERRTHAGSGASAELRIAPAGSTWTDCATVDVVNLWLRHVYRRTRPRGS